MRDGLEYEVTVVTIFFREASLWDVVSMWFALRLERYAGKLERLGDRM